jgi:2-oxoglutarate ferredoxin oxidoreductase subunit alpha
MAKPIEQLQDVIIRFAGDSGDGMQLTGGRFTSETALFGNDLSTLPDFPAEIRAPAGSLPGVSGFQIHYADHDILTPGDAPHVLVAMNLAALRTNLNDLAAGGALIVNSDAFSDRNLQKAGYTSNPLEDGSLDEYRVHEVPLTSLTVEAVKGTTLALTPRDEKYLQAVADDPSIVQFGFAENPDDFKLWLLERGHDLLKGTGAHRPVWEIEAN